MVDFLQALERLQVPPPLAPSVRRLRRAASGVPRGLGLAAAVLWRGGGQLEPLFRRQDM